MTRTLWDVVAEWTDHQLDRLLDALKRDRSLSPKELAEFLRPKTAIKIQELISVLLDTTEEELIGSSLSVELQPYKPESLLDILIQTTRHLSGEELAFSAAIGQVIDQHAKWLGQQERSALKAQVALAPGLRFSDVYEFLAALLLNRPLPNLSEASSGVVLDLVSSLAELLELLRNGDVGAFPELVDMRKAFEAASAKVTDCTGIFLATAAAVQLAASLNASGEDWPDDLMRTLPVAPIFVLRDVRRTTSLKATRELQRVLLRKFCGIWELPEIRDNLNSLSTSTSPANPIFGQLVKSLSMFALNPFLLPRSVINPFQSLLCKLCGQTCSRSVDPSHLVSFFKSVMISDLQSQSKTADPEDGVPTTSVPRQTKRQKKRCYQTDPSCDTPSDTPTKKVRRSRKRTTSRNEVTEDQTVEATGTDNARTSASTLSSSSIVVPLQLPKTGNSNQFFRRVHNRREMLVNRKTYRKHFLVRDTFDRNPKP